MPTTSARLLALLSLLQARRDWPGPVLADRLDVSSRTVRRDVDRLRGLGYPIAAIKGPDGGYRLEAGSELPPLLFDDDQAVALAVALQLATTAEAGIEESAMRALTTVRQVMPGRMRRRIDALEVTAIQPPSPRPGPAVDPGVLSTLGAAVHAAEVLRFDYAPHDGLMPARRVEPHRLLFWGSRWYLLAWDLDGEDWRTFRADRIAPKAATGPRFEPRPVPGGDLDAFITGRFRGSEDGTSAWPCRGEVLLDRSAMEITPYVRDAVITAEGPDRCRLVLGSWSWPALAAAIASFDAEIEVVGPRELATAFGVLSRRFARAAAPTL